MATIAAASPNAKSQVTSGIIRDLTAQIGVKLPEKDVEQWRELIASVQDSIDIVEALPDYIPSVDLNRFPRENVHRPKREENPGNAWAYKVRINGVVTLANCSDIRSPSIGTVRWPPACNLRGCCVLIRKHA